MQQGQTRLHEDGEALSVWRDRELWLHFSLLVFLYTRHAPRDINHQNELLYFLE